MTLQLAELRDRVAEWAARHHGDELLAATRRHLADRADRDQVQSAIAFALVVPPSDGPSLVERYAAEPGTRPRAERVLLQRWATTWFSLLRITHTQPDQWLDVHDVLRDTHLRIHDRSASRVLRPGTWLAAFFHQADGRWVLEGTVAGVGPVARVYAVQAALAACADLGRLPSELDPQASRRMAGPTMEAIYHASRPPRLINADRHDLLVVTSTLDLSWSQVTAVLDPWDDVDLDEDLADVLGPDPLPYAGGYAARATFRLEDGVVTLSANSRERHTQILERWRAHTGAALPVRHEETHTPPSNPLGPEVISDTTSVTLSEAHEFVTGIGDRWAEIPVPALGNISPREALAQGRRAEVWALLPVEPGHRAAAAASLGLGEPTPH